MQDVARVKLVDKGWSGERKYYIELAGGEKQLLRLAKAERYEAKRAEYAMLARFAGMGLPVPEPLDVGLCENGESVYLLLTWCEGEAAEEALLVRPEAVQYALGVRSGEILRTIHSIPAPEDTPPWGAYMRAKIGRRIQAYRDCGISFAGADLMISYSLENLDLLDGRPQCYQHGDYHLGNMVLSAEDALSVIDFEKMSYGDPWEEFNRIVFSARISGVFASGQLNGYFGGRPPEAFFRLLALYMTSNAYGSVPWAIPFGQEDVQNMLDNAALVLQWYDGMKTIVPSWYHEPMQ